MPSGSRGRRGGGELVELRAKAALYDELVEQLAIAEDEVERLTRSPGVDPAWREIATELAGALRPYTLFDEQRVRNGRIIVETTVPGATLSAASRVLDRLADQLRLESHRTDGNVASWRESPTRRAA